MTIMDNSSSNTETTDSQKPKKKAAKPLNRWSLSTLSLIQILSLFVLVIAGNILAGHYFKRKDLSRGDIFSLSQWSRSLVGSTAVQSRPSPVKILVAFRRSSAFRDRVRNLAFEYASHSQGKIVVEHFDPVRDVDRALRVAQTYKLAPENNLLNREDLIIIDAREDTTAPVTAEENAKIRFVTQERMLLHDNNGGKTARRVAAFQGEDAITTSLLSAIEGKPRNVFFLADKSDMATEIDGGPWSVLMENLLSQNIVPLPVRFAELQEIPEACAGLIIASPRYDFTEKEMELLRAYWNRPGSNIMVILRARQAPERLRAFLRENGVTPRSDTIVSLRGKQPRFSVDASFDPGFPFLSDFWNKTTTFDGLSSSLEVRENDDLLGNRNIQPVPLISASSQYWGETGKNLDAPVFNDVEDISAPLTLAAAVTRGMTNSDQFSEKTSRMLVLGNASFLDPASIRSENTDFLRASANWLVGREELCGTGPQVIGTFRLPILSSQATFINRINLFFLPVAFLLISLVIWNARRS